jgi:deoxyribonuclease-4
MRRDALPPGQRRFGAHVSVAGGLHTAFERALEAGCDVIQVFVKNQRQWAARPLGTEEISAWQAARWQAGIETIVAHGTYLTNLAAPGDVVWKRSVATFRDELIRCEQLDILGLITHPGSHLGTGEEAGIKRIAEGLDIIHAETEGFRTKTLLEITAGQGTCIGCTFEHIAAIIGRVRHPDRVGVCFDTCHAFAAGYELRTAEGYAETMTKLSRVIGVERIACFHVNDSCKTLGTRVDRHAGIGQGCLGTKAFRHLVNDRRFLRVPMLLETPKGLDERGRDLDRANLAALRRLVINRKSAGRPPRC